MRTFYTCFWFSLISYSVCIKCRIILVAAFDREPAEDSFPKENWKIWRRSSNFQHRQLQRGLEDFRISNDSEENVFFSTDKCSRYCIKRQIDENGNSVQYINLFWTNGIDAMDQSSSKDHSEFLSKTEWTDARNPDIIQHRNCQIYLDLDCNIIETRTSNYANREFHLENDEKNKGKKITDIIKIAEKYNLSEQTQMNFSVDNSIHRIVIDIDGNVSNALLRIPTNTTVSRHGTIISWTSKGDAEGVRIETWNPPSGEWRLKLVGEDRSKYQLTVMGFVDENCDEIKNLSLESETKENINEDTIKNYRINIKMKDDILGNDKETFNNEATKINSEKIMVKQNSNPSMNSEMMENKKITQERSLTYRMRDQKENNHSRKENFSDNDLSIISSTENMLINFVEYVTFVDVDKNVITTSNEKFLERKEDVFALKS
ncbi:uncharacterized protein LOC133667807 [Apis cerana]|uniref:uncharacterized protein LOC133667807 n=1 Tax=Apis cerana TaxID=7461 RepID=UPI002B22B7EE|nr:uncharacterized protein LOC133667807 [Apis cerana]